jgi:hypothetical protein
VPAVTQDLVLVEVDGLSRIFGSCRSAGDRGYDAYDIAVLDRRRSFLGVANVLVIEVNVHEIPQSTVAVVKVGPQSRVLFE